MQFIQEQPGSIRVEEYNFNLKTTVVIGWIKPAERYGNYWRFYPTNNCELTTGMCKRISIKLASLNTLKSLHTS